MTNKLKHAVATLAIALSAVADAQAGEWIRINQLGYLPKATKVAVMMCEDTPEVKTFEIRDAFTDKVVLSSDNIKATGPLGNMKATFRLCFSTLDLQGTY